MMAMTFQKGLFSKEIRGRPNKKGHRYEGCHHHPQPDALSVASSGASGDTLSSQQKEKVRRSCSIQ